MTKIIEAIPNFSEGRREIVLERLAKAAASVPGVALLDYSADYDHNRSVYTVAGEPPGIEEVSFKLCKTAADNIDMKEHTGAHPRMGATDVLPFVPIKGVTEEDCIELSRRVAKRIYDELKIPTFLYEAAASREERRNLADIRRGEFEGMPEKLLLQEWAPDFGERKIHKTAGVTAVGVRFPLIAFNLNLNTSDVSIAKAIARTVRGSSGGYACCKAIGLFLEEKGIAQVSTNMVNFERTPLYRVFEAVRSEARRYGAEVVGTEIIGLVPAKALVDCAEYYLRIEDFDYERRVLENRINALL